MRETIAKTSARFGRSAAIVHALALVFGAIIFASYVWIRPGDRRAWEVIRGLAGAAAGMLALWSWILAVRAVRRGESIDWPLMVFSATMGEIAGPFIFLYYIMIFRNYRSETLWMYGLPVFVPFLTLGTMVALNVAISRVQRAQAANPQLERRRLCKRGLLWFFGTMLGLAVVFVPVPLFLLCAGYKYHEFNRIDQFTIKETRSWQLDIAQNTPDFIRDTVRQFVEKNCTSPQSSVEDMMLYNGAVSQRRLRKQILRNQRAEMAMWGLRRTNPEAFVEYAHLIADGKLSAPEFLQDAGHTLAMRSTPEQMEAYLKPNAFKSDSVLAGFYWQLAQRDSETALRGLDGVLTAPPSGWNTRENAYSLYLQFAHGARLETACLRYLNDPDPKLREHVARDVHRIPDSALKQKMILASLSHSIQNVRIAFVSEWSNVRMLMDDPEISREAFASYAAVFEGNDLVLRRAAVWYVAGSVGYMGYPLTPEFDQGVGNVPVSAGGTPVPETAAELEELKKIRELVAGWQRKREQNTRKAK